MANPNALAGALIVAWAAQDGEAFNTALRDVYEHHAAAETIMALVSTAAHAVVQMHGDEWPEAMRAALLAEAARDVDGGSTATG